MCVRVCVCVCTCACACACACMCVCERDQFAKVLSLLNVYMCLLILLQISVGLCIGFGVKFREPKYFLLLVNLLCKL